MSHFLTHGIRGVSMVLLLAMPVWGQQELDPRIVNYADMVLVNGKVLTADEVFTITEAIAVRDGEVLARGTSADILKLAGPNTRRVDLRGRSVVPGFLHTHSHGWLGQPALGRSVWSLGGGSLSFSSVEAGLEELRQLAAKKPKGEWVMAYAFRSKLSLGVTKEQIDAVVPDHPVLFTLSTYEINLNSKALNMFLDYVGDRAIEGLLVDEKGEPTGQLRGVAAGVYGYEFMDWPNLTAMRPRELARLKRYTEEGYTTLIGRAPGASITLLRDIWAAGELPLRVRLTHEFLRDNPNPERFLKRMGNLTGLGDDWMKIIGLIVQQPDGGSSAGAILTSLPKLRLAPGDGYGPFGQDRWAEYSNAREGVALAGRYGWRVGSVHSYGDRSTMNLLEAFDKAAAAPKILDTGPGLPNAPWVVDHNFMGTPETIALMKRLNVVPSVNLWFPRVPREIGTLNDPDGEGQGGFTPSMGNALVYMYGSDRLNDNWGLGRAYLENGVKPAAELEGGGTALQDIEARITRRDADGRVWAPQEAVTRQEALRMKTIWAAAITGDDDRIGSLEEGKLADFVVLDGDYMTVPEQDIGELPVLMTVVGGKVVYEAESVPQ